MGFDAMYYTKDEMGEFLCQLCPHECKIGLGKYGICGVRVHREDKLECDNYGEISSFGFDPIEKKPLYHYKPGSYIASVGSMGCNFDCGFCQNYSISREKPATRKMTPTELVELAEKMKKEGNIGIAFTYNEPSIWYEYVFESAKLLKERQLDVILVTNGFINREPLEKLLPYVNAMNIDLKSFSSEFYKKSCKGELKRVLETIEYASGMCHVEIATLLIGRHNDSPNEIRDLSRWLSSINEDIPLHLSRYFPAYKFTDPPTPMESIQSCEKIAKEFLHYVYLGNVRNVDNNTYCYKCGNRLIDRNGYETKLFIETDKCPQCGVKLNIIL